MGKRHLFHLFSILCLGLAAISLVSHHLADATGFGCQINVTGICQAGENTLESLIPDEDTESSQTLHAGFDVPPGILLPTAPILIRLITIFVLAPATIESPTLPLPPQ